MSVFFLRMLFFCLFYLDWLHAAYFNFVSRLFSFCFFSLISTDLSLDRSCLFILFFFSFSDVLFLFIIFSTVFSSYFKLFLYFFCFLVFFLLFYFSSFLVCLLF